MAADRLAEPPPPPAELPQQIQIGHGGRQYVPVTTGSLLNMSNGKIGGRNIKVAKNH